MVSGWYGTEAGLRFPFKCVSLCGFSSALLLLQFCSSCLIDVSVYAAGKASSNVKTPCPITEDKLPSALLPAAFSQNISPGFSPLWLSSSDKCSDAAWCLVFIGDVLKAVWSLQLGTVSERFTNTFYRQVGALMWLPQQETASDRWIGKN